jgi:hypothetical protein
MDLSSHSPLVGVWGVALTSDEINSLVDAITASHRSINSSMVISSPHGMSSRMRRCSEILTSSNFHD